MEWRQQKRGATIEPEHNCSLIARHHEGYAKAESRLDVFRHRAEPVARSERALAQADSSIAPQLTPRQNLAPVGGPTGKTLFLMRFAIEN